MTTMTMKISCRRAALIFARAFIEQGGRLLFPGEEEA